MAELGPCFECGQPATEKAHIVPKSRGGTKTVPLCGRCHGLSHGMPRAQDIGQLTRDGIVRARAAGVVLGRPRMLPAVLVQRVVDLRADGATLAAIADLLTLEGTPTAQGGARWYASTVRAVLTSATLTCHGA